MSNIGYVNIGLTALDNAAQAGALQLSSIAYLNQITTCTLVANSCLLPANPPYGLICKVRNDSATAYPLYVFPQVGGEINGLGVNASYNLPVSCLVEFVAVSGNNWLVSSSSFSNGQNVSNDFLIPYPLGDQVGVAFNADIADSGALFQIAHQTDAGLVFNIPSPVGNAGLRYKIQLTGATAGQNITVTPAAGEFNGCLYNNIAAGVTCVVCTGKADIVIEAGATIGTTLDLVSDGTNYIAFGFGTLDGANWA